jgi:hypothetical protein
MQVSQVSTGDGTIAIEKAKAEGELYNPPPLRPFNPAQPVGSGADRQSKNDASVAFLTGCRRRIPNQL